MKSRRHRAIDKIYKWKYKDKKSKLINYKIMKRVWLRFYAKNN